MGKNIFISYYTGDRKKVLSIKRDLEADGHHIWFYPKSVEAGDHIVQSEQDGIEKCDFVLLMWSSQSEKRRAVKEEIKITKAGKKKLIIIKIDPTLSSKRRDKIQVCDLSNENSYAIELNRLLKTLNNNKLYSLVVKKENLGKHPGWRKVNIRIKGNLKLVEEVDYHLHIDLAKAGDTKDYSTDRGKGFQIIFYTNAPERVFSVINLTNGTFEEHAIIV